MLPLQSRLEPLWAPRDASPREYLLNDVEGADADSQSNASREQVDRPAKTEGEQCRIAKYSGDEGVNHPRKTVPSRVDKAYRVFQSRG